MLLNELYAWLPVALNCNAVVAPETGGTPPIQLVPTLQDPLLGFTQV
jgi:hypothetical protein